MKATFRLAGDVEVAIGEQIGSPGYVLFELSNPLNRIGTPERPATDPFVGSMSVKKSVARAIASALMGAAADA